VRESLSEILGRDEGMTVFGHYAALDDALRETLTRRADVLMLDATFTNGKGAVKLIRETVPQVRVVVFAVIETEENVIAWAQVGVAGYVPSTAALGELTTLLRDISAGKQTCSALVAAALLRQVASDAHFGVADPTSVALLTARELEPLAIPTMTGVDGLRGLADLVPDFAALATAGLWEFHGHTSRRVPIGLRQLALFL
jgi:DNA-binding NarL/FixJ family response regulator